MIGLIQRVSFAAIEVEGSTIASIQDGVLAFVGIEKNDADQQAEQLIDKILSYRIFEDENKKMNLCVKDLNGGLLLVPQFTLIADTSTGTRPGFSSAMEFERSDSLFTKLVKIAQQKYSSSSAGLFGTTMNISSCNVGPATFILKI